MEFVVTGGAGFIGSHLAEALLKKGGVTVVDNLSSGFKENVPEGVELVNASVLDYGKLEEAISTADVVFHLGGVVGVPVSIRHPDFCFRVNVNGTANVLEAAKKHGSRVVFASSAAVYGDRPKVPSRETDTTAPASPYAESKLQAEKQLAAFAGEVQTIALRLFNVFGPRQNITGGYAAVVPAFVNAAKKGRPLKIEGDGSQTRDFVFVEDAVQAFLLAGEKGSGVYNIGSGKPTRIKELAKKIIALAESESQIVFAPGREGDVHDSLADVSKAKKDLGYSPKHSLGEGLRKVIEYG